MEYIYAVCEGFEGMPDSYFKTMKGAYKEYRRIKLSDYQWWGDCRTKHGKTCGYHGNKKGWITEVKDKPTSYPYHIIKIELGD